VTDADGRVAIEPFPPGPAQLRVSLFNSSYVARVTVPDGGREVAVAIPGGLLQARVTDHVTQQPIGGAQLTWVGGGGRVEALATPNGDALLEGVGVTGGRLTISAGNHQILEGNFDETPETHQDIALMPVPGARLSLRVIGSAAEPLAGAIVQLLPSRASDVAEFVMADAKGIATFVDAPAGPLQFTAHADGHAATSVRVAEEGRVAITITLARTP
jgi:hypothetical protein